MNKLTLYWSIGSQPGRAVKTLLDIGRIPHEAVRVNVPQMEHKSPSYLKINPFGLIPAIQDGEFKLAESSAILIYLCEKHPHITSYYGKDLYERAKVNQYLSWYQNYFRPALFKPFRKFLAAAGGSALNEPEVIILWKEMWEAIQKLDSIMLSNNTEYIAGNSPSIADLLYFYELTNLTYFKTDHNKYLKISQWYSKINCISEVAKIMSQFQETRKRRAEVFEQIFIIKNTMI